MSQDTPITEEQLFMYLVGTFQSSAWIAMGKMKNPMTDKKDQNLDQASYYIDLLEMLQNKTKGNLTEYEEQLIIKTVSELKMTFIEAQQIHDSSNKSNDESTGEKE